MKTINHWPLVVTLEDVFVPGMAQIVVEVAAEYESEVRGLVIHFAAEKARELWTVN